MHFKYSAQNRVPALPYMQLYMYQFQILGIVIVQVHIVDLLRQYAHTGVIKWIKKHPFRLHTMHLLIKLKNSYTLRLVVSSIMNQLESHIIYRTNSSFHL